MFITIVLKGLVSSGLNYLTGGITLLSLIPVKHKVNSKKEYIRIRIDD